jgi:carboxylesterase type B
MTNCGLGDPTKITLWGESAGAGSVGFHLTAYGGRDDKLFRGAIMESGNPVYYGSIRDSKSYEEQYDTLLSRTGCNNSTESLQCLRKIPAATFNAIINGTTSGTKLVGWGPAANGDFVKKDATDGLPKGGFVRVPIISGG